MNRDEIKRDENGQNMFDRQCLLQMDVLGKAWLKLVAATIVEGQVSINNWTVTVAGRSRLAASLNEP